MTARRVVDPPGGEPACRVRVFVGNRNVEVQKWKWWRISRTGDGRADDLATLRLNQPLAGHFFEIRTGSVPLGTNLAMVGHPLGNQLALTQGKLMEHTRYKGVPEVEVRLLSAEGASGSPFLDDEGRVVGILQTGLGSKDVLGQETAGVVLGIDLSEYWDGAAWLTLCRAYPTGGIPECSPTPAVPPAPPGAPAGNQKAAANAAANLKPLVMKKFKQVAPELMIGEGTCEPARRRDRDLPRPFHRQAGRRERHLHDELPCCHAVSNRLTWETTAHSCTSINLGTKIPC